MTADDVTRRLIGAGAAGQAHAFGWRNVAMAAGLDHVDVDLAVVVDPNVDLAQKTANRYGYRTASADLQAVLDDPGIDAVSVACPTARTPRCCQRSGVRQARADREADRRSATEAAPLAAAAEQSNAITGVGFSFRRLPGLAAVHDLVSDGAIGDVHSFTAWYNADYGSSPDAPFGWRYAKDTAGAGALIDIGTHAIDTVQHVLGPIRRVVSAALQTVITRRPIPGRATSAPSTPTTSPCSPSSWGTAPSGRSTPAG
jgi:predicted dehydrogenase